VFVVYPSRGEKYRRIYGLRNAINTVADVCIPGVPQNISIVNPRRKPTISNHNLLISKGNTRINITYKNGFIYPFI
jgi:hypothetical protein